MGYLYSYPYVGIIITDKAKKERVEFDLQLVAAHLEVYRIEEFFKQECAHVNPNAEWDFDNIKLEFVRSQED